MWWYDGCEARGWFAQNKNKHSFAGNRFRDNQAALAFVNHLYELGAELVGIWNIFDEDWRIEENEGPYADTLSVRLPDDPEKRKQIFRIHKQENQEEEFMKPDAGQGVITFWWD